MKKYIFGILFFLLFTLNTYSFDNVYLSYEECFNKCESCAQTCMANGACIGAIDCNGPHFLDTF